MTDLRPVRSVEKLVDREGIADILCVSVDVIDDMRKAGLPFLKWGRKPLIRFRPSECLQWWDEQRKEAA